MPPNPYFKSPLNYTGGKHKLLPQIIPIFENLGNINTFVDLFCGGYNVGLNVNTRRIIANDLNKQVIDLLNCIKETKIEDILRYIRKRIDQYGLNITNQEGYDDFREFYNNSDKNPLDLFVLICFSFNHQIRFNKKDEYNMPFGKNRSAYNATIEKNLINFKKKIDKQNVFFVNKDFSELKIEKLTENDLVYCDPPYLITCATYNEKDGWNDKKEVQLLSLLDNIDSKNIKFALSNVFQSKGKVNQILIDWTESNKYTVHHLNNTYANCNYHTKDKETKPDEVLICNF